MPSNPADEFLAGLPEERLDIARAVHETITSAAPQLEPWLWRGKMWGGTDQTILGYGAYDYVNRSGDDQRWYVVGLANQKSYLSLYVHAVRDGRYLGRVYGDRLGKVELGSASISFRSLEDLDLDVVAEMVADAAANPPAELL